MLFAFMHLTLIASATVRCIPQFTKTTPTLLSTNTIYCVTESEMWYDIYQSCNTENIGEKLDVCASLLKTLTCTKVIHETTGNSDHTHFNNHMSSTNFISLHYCERNICKKLKHRLK